MLRIFLEKFADCFSCEPLARVLLQFFCGVFQAQLAEVLVFVKRFCEREGHAIEGRERGAAEVPRIRNVLKHQRGAIHWPVSQIGHQSGDSVSQLNVLDAHEPRARSIIKPCAVGTLINGFFQVVRELRQHPSFERRRKLAQIFQTIDKS